MGCGRAGLLGIGEKCYGATTRHRELKLCLGRLPIRCLRLRHGHIVIAGRTGSGKTNTVKVIIEEALRRSSIGVMVLDWAGEYTELEQYTPGENLRFNVVAGVLQSASQQASFITDLFSTVYNLSDPQSYLLYKAAKRLRQPYRLSDLIATIEGLETRNYRELDIKAALLRRLEPLNDGVLGRTLNGASPPTEIFRRAVSVRLDRIHSIRERILLSIILLRHLYEYMLLGGFSNRITHVTVLEEAWNIIPYRRREELPSIGERLFLELRKYGECLIAVTQSLRDLSERAIRNASLIIIHPSPVDETRILDIPDAQKPRKVGEALVIREDGRTAILKIRRAKSTPVKMIQGTRNSFYKSRKMVAGGGFEPPTSGL